MQHTTKQVKELEAGDRINTKDGLLEVLGVRRFKEGEAKHPIQVTFQNAEGKLFTTPYTSPSKLVLVQGNKTQQSLFQ